jgi:transposase InsO family protein
VIQQLAPAYPVRLLCELWDYPRSTFYYQPKPMAEADLCAALQRLAATWPTHGSRWFAQALRREGWVVNRKRIRRLMRVLGLQRKNKRQTVWTTHSRHGWRRYPNLVQNLAITHPDQLWVADLTYVRLRGEFVYLAIVLDVFTRNIRGWHLSRSLDTRLSQVALDRALLQHRPEIHHSDQGLHYAIPSYVARLEQVGAQISMAEVGAAWQNGYAERMIRTIKEEEIGLSDYGDFQEAYDQIGRFIDEVYARKRLHSSLGYLTPMEFERHWRGTNQKGPLTTPY